ncbi:Uncharacterised protein [Candidatus Anstonella stagnisolia]|nr:Uncharacterised protein [Candidatus Anstonella stagnisolia]
MFYPFFKPAQLPMAAMQTPSGRQTPLLDVYCPRANKLGLEDAKIILLGISRKVLDNAGKTGIPTPSIVLFSEDAFRYRYSITSEQALDGINSLMRVLAEDVWMACCLSIMETSQNYMEASNTGYFFSSSQLLSSPKRLLTDWDRVVLREFGPSISMCSKRKIIWQERTEELVHLQKPFPMLPLPNGINVEHRVCGDVGTKPLMPMEDSVTLVSAFRLDNYQLKALSLRRNTILANDGENGILHSEHNMFSVAAAPVQSSPGWKAVCISKEE